MDESSIHIKVFSLGKHLLCLKHLFLKYCLKKYAKENEKAQEQPLTAAAVQNNPAINSVNSASQAPQADNITSNSLGASDNQEVKINDIPSGYTQRDSGFIVPREPSKRNFQEPKTRIPTVDDILDDNHNRPDNTNL